MSQRTKMTRRISWEKNILIKLDLLLSVASDNERIWSASGVFCVPVETRIRGNATTNCIGISCALTYLTTVCSSFILWSR